MTETGMSLDMITLSEVSHKKKDKHHTRVAYTWNLTRGTMDLAMRQKQTHRQRTG